MTSGGLCLSAPASRHSSETPSFDPSIRTLQTMCLIPVVVIFWVSVLPARPPSGGGGYVCGKAGWVCVGGGGLRFVGESGMPVPLLTTAATAHVAPTALPALTNCTPSHSQTVEFGGGSPARLTWAVVTQGREGLGRQLPLVLHRNRALPPQPYTARGTPPRNTSTCVESEAPTGTPPPPLFPPASPLHPRFRGVKRFSFSTAVRPVHCLSSPGGDMGASELPPAHVAGAQGLGQADGQAVGASLCNRLRSAHHRPPMRNGSVPVLGPVAEAEETERRADRWFRLLGEYPTKSPAYLHLLPANRSKCVRARDLGRGS